GPDEKIGVVVLEGGRAKVIEYSDLSREEADRRDERGRLVFWAGSPAIHAFRIDFTRRAASGAVKLPYHVAAKEIPAVDAEGRPCKIQGFKYETFVFDALPEASRFLNLEIVREQEFAPIKNRSGVDSLESARELMVSEHRRWLGEVGIDARGAVEISPLAAAEPGDLAGALAAWNGRTFERDIRVERSREGEIVIEEIAGSAPSNGS
ncbi:MAG: hypothetical protein JXA90_14970, partial [Planctomycetes bacterium]|nr:hypothetical protein [Planctomycetota bacterium]